MYIVIALNKYLNDSIKTLNTVLFLKKTYLIKEYSRLKFTITAFYKKPSKKNMTATPNLEIMFLPSPLTK